MLLQVHDELVFEISQGEEELIEPIRSEMERALPLKVPVEVEQPGRLRLVAEHRFGRFREMLGFEPAKHRHHPCFSRYGMVSRAAELCGFMGCQIPELVRRQT